MINDFLVEFYFYENYKFLIKRLLTAEQMSGAYILLPLGRCPVRRSEYDLCLMGGARISSHTHTPTLPTTLSIPFTPLDVI